MSRRKSESNIKALSSKSNSELLEMIDQAMRHSADELDTDLVNTCLDLLQTRAPVMEEYDPKSSLDKFRESHPNICEVDEPPIHAEKSKAQYSGNSFLRCAGILVAGILCLIIIANAFGYHPIQGFLLWVNNTIQLFHNPSGLMELPADDPSEYRSLDEALEACGAVEADRITWIPQDYSLVNVRVSPLSEFHKISAIFESERGDMAIRIIWADIDMNTVTEGDDERIEYIHNGTAYYITSNFERMKAGWQDDKYSYEISGQITEEEIKKMIDSVS